MRIGIYTESALPMMGGQELVVDALARQFLAQGHEAVVLAPQPRHRARNVWHALSPRRAWRQAASLPYPVVRHPRFVSTRYFLDWYAWFLAPAHARYRFDVLHCHSVYPAAYVAARCAALADVPIVVTSHCGDICPESRLLSKPGLPQRFDAALARADAAVAISRFVEDRLRALCPRLRRIVRIDNGVDMAQFTARTTRPEGLVSAIQPGNYFLYLGRLVRRKGLDLLLDAFSLADLPEHAHLVVAGAGEDAVELQTLAARSAAASRAHFVGLAHGNLKIWLLQNSLALVMPSRISEGFPLVVLESYAAGRPVIGTRIPGLEELLEPVSPGMLVPSDSPAELALALQAAHAGRPRLDRGGEAGRQFAAARDWSRIAQQYLALFSELRAARATRWAA